MSISAADVKRLRDETSAPMMDCKRALTEANGDFEKAKQILRESGAATAAKKAGRATKEGVAKIVADASGSKAAGVIVVCETDFVSGNDDFKSMVQSIADGFLAEGKAGADVAVNGSTAGDIIQEAVGKIRENIQLADSFFVDGSKYAIYNHHDGKWASLVEYEGESADAAVQTAIQVVAFKPEFLSVDDVPKDFIDREIEVETARAMKEGKPQNVAENIAKGRVNKQFMQEKVLLEQPYYGDGKVKMKDYLKENGNITIKSYQLLSVANVATEGE